MTTRRRTTPARGFRVTALGAVAATAAATLTLTAAGTAHAAGRTGRLADTKPSWATPAADRGAVSAATHVDFDVVLSLRDKAGATALLKGISTPGSATYHHYLNTGQFRSAFAPTAASLAAVRGWATSTGLHVESVSSNNMYVEVSGTAAQAGRLLGVSLHTYAHAGSLDQAPDADYAVPTALTGTVAGIVGLDSTAAKPASATGASAHAAATTSADSIPAQDLPGPPAGVRYGVQPCSAYYKQKIATTLPSAYGAKQPYTICGYDAKQYESAFGYAKPIAAGNDGSGVTVAITDAYAAPTILGDANTWSSQNGIPTFAPGQFTQVLPNSFNAVKQCGAQGWYGEETLDVEAVHAMAPGAKIVYVGGKNCGGGLNNAFGKVIDEHLASVVTDSWLEGEPEVLLPLGTIVFFDNYLLEAGLTGVSALFASGDHGDNAASGIRYAAFPGTDPFATSVGGTSTEIAKNGSIALQTGWSNSYSVLNGNAWTPRPPGNYGSGSGGGESEIFVQPFYQQGVVPAIVSRHGSGHPMRAVPDISMPGDPNTGLRIGETQTFPNGTYYDTYRLGGTSLASPLLAGVLADTIQADGHELGLINPAIYGSYASTPAVTDVTSVKQVATVRVDYANFLDSSEGYLIRLQTLDIPTTISTRVGYDDMTGLGTPNGVKFYAAFRS